MERPYPRDHSCAIDGLGLWSSAFQELKQIRAFAESAAGTHYLTSKSIIRRDPEVAKVDNQMINEVNAACAALNLRFQDRLMAYLKVHPDVALR